VYGVALLGHLLHLPLAGLYDLIGLSQAIQAHLVVLLILKSEGIITISRERTPKSTDAILTGSIV